MGLIQKAGSPYPQISPTAILVGLYQQGHVITCGGPRHLAFIGPFFHKELLKIIFYDCIGNEINIMQAGLCTFFSYDFKRN